MNTGATESAPSPPATPPEVRAAAVGNRPRPSLLDIVFVIWAVIIPIGFGYRLLNSDGDLARHLHFEQRITAGGECLHEQEHGNHAQPLAADPAGNVRFDR